MLKFWLRCAIKFLFMCIIQEHDQINLIFWKQMINHSWSQNGNGKW
jgi:hypothetical protein